LPTVKPTFLALELEVCCTTSQQSTPQPDAKSILLQTPLVFVEMKGIHSNNLQKKENPRILIN
jgi:hypothetical protein